MSYTAEQRKMISLARGLSRGYSRRVQLALLEAMAVETNFRNLNYGDRDSQGVLQQRPSMGWGPPGNAAQDIRQFLARAGELDRGFKGTPGQLAQAIQRSAFPGRYDERASEVASLLGGGLGGASGSQAVSRANIGNISDSGDPRRALLASLIEASQSGATSQRNPDYSSVFSSLRALGTAERAPASVSSSPGAGALPGGPGSPGGAAGGSIDDLLRRFGLADAVTSGYRPGARTKSGSVSFHASNRARDIDPSDPGFQKLVSYLRAHPSSVNEFFYDKLPWYIDEGRIRRGRVGGHLDHAHLAR